MKTHPLPVRPIPYTDESPASLLIRAAEANGHASVFQLLSKVRAIRSKESLIAHWTRPRRYQELTLALGLGEDAANLAWLRAGPTSHSPRLYGGLPVSESLFTLDGTRFCPRCLRKEPYWRRQWSILPFSGCVEHSCLLLDRCSACGRILTAGRGCLVKCNHCGADLDAMKAQRIKPAPLFVLESLIEQKNGAAVTELLNFWEALARFDGLGNAPQAAFDRLALATYWFGGSPLAVDQVANQLARQEVAYPRAALLPFLTAEQPLVDFAEKVLERLPPLPGRKYSYGESTPAALTKREACAVLGISSAELLTLIRTEQLIWPGEGGRQPKIPFSQIESYLERHQRGDDLPRRYGNGNEQVSDESWLDVKTMALRWQVHPEVVRSLISAEWLPGRNRTVNRCRKMMVSQDEVCAFEGQFALIGTLAREWGVNSTNLGEKLKSLGIKAVGGPGIDRVLTSVFKRADIASVDTQALQAIEHYPTRTGRKRKGEPQNAAKREGIATSEVAELLGINTQQVAVLLRRGVLQRTAQLYRPTRVDRGSYWKLSRTLQRDDLLSIEAAAEQLGVGVPWFRSNWVITGIIKVIDLGIWRFVTRDEVEMVKQLRGKYFTATEAGNALGMHRTHMLNLEKQGLVEPLRFGKNKQLRLYERDTVRNLVRQQRAAPDSWADEAPREKPTPLKQNRPPLQLPEAEAVNCEPPRLTWESFWEGKLEGWDEAEVKRATKPAGS